MARAVNAFNGLMGGDRCLTEAEGWLFMCCLKMARNTSGTPNLDDAIDLAGYAGLWGECYMTPSPEASPEAPADWRGRHFNSCAVHINRGYACTCGVEAT